MTIRLLSCRCVCVFLILLFTPVALWAQSVLQGRVLDQTNEPLSLASVVLGNKLGKMIAGQASSLQGTFYLKDLVEGTYTLEISYVGYKSYKRVIELKKGIFQIGDIKLEEAGRLGEVQVVAKATEVVVKGDTIEYNASSYKTEEGATLIELLKKTPWS